MPAAASALFGLGVLFTIWWWYFDRIRATREYHVRSRRDAIRQHVWSYAHFPFYLGIVILGVGLQRLVTVATHSRVPEDDMVMWVLASLLLVPAMLTIAAHTGRSSAGVPSPTNTRQSPVAWPGQDASSVTRAAELLQ